MSTARRERIGAQQSHEASRHAVACAELAHINRVMTMGELTASIAHEIKQPLAAIVNNANAGVRFLQRPSPDLEEVQQVLADISEQGKMAGDVISRIRAQMKKVDTVQADVDINRSIQEVLSLVHGERKQHNISVRTELATALPPVLGDRVQLQQVILT